MAAKGKRIQTVDADEGSVIAAGDLFRTHGAFVGRILAHLGVPGPEIDDIVQEVFLIVHRRGGYQPGTVPPSTYLASIAHRVELTHRRKRAVRSFIRLGVRTPDTAGPSADDPLRKAEANESLERAHRAVLALEPKLRIIFVLMELEGQTGPAVAAGLRIPLTTVHARLRSARQGFRRAWAAAQDVPCMAAALPRPS